MKKACCDLHTHSVFSDGTFTPTELVNEAEKLGLSAIALTDHNTTYGLTEFLTAAKGKKLEAIPGVELSTDYGTTELHIIGLFIEPKYFDRVERLVDELKIRKHESNIALVKALNEAGYDIDYEEIEAKTPKGHLNRAHFAAALTEKGYTASVREAFSTLLSKGGGFYKEPKRLPVYETIAFLKSINAVTVLAHPFLNLTEEELRVFLPKAKEYGLDAMETAYSAYDAETAKRAAEMAAEFGLKQSGGSDFHGGNRPYIALGTGIGELAVPTEFLDKLKEGRGSRAVEGGREARGYSMS